MAEVTIKGKALIKKIQNGGGYTPSTGELTYKEDGGGATLTINDNGEKNFRSIIVGSSVDGLVSIVNGNIHINNVALGSPKTALFSLAIETEDYVYNLCPAFVSSFTGNFGFPVNGVMCSSDDQIMEPITLIADISGGDIELYTIDDWNNFGDPISFPEQTIVEAVVQVL